MKHIATVYRYMGIVLMLSAYFVPNKYDMFLTAFTGITMLALSFIAKKAYGKEKTPRYWHTKGAKKKSIFKLYHQRKGMSRWQ